MHTLIIIPKFKKTRLLDKTHNSADIDGEINDGSMDDSSMESMRHDIAISLLDHVK